MKVIAVALLCVLIVLGAGLSVRAGAWLRRVGQARPMDCAGTAPLVPETRAGLPWQPHRHGLLPAEGQVGRHDSYLVRNLRTGEMFRWGRDRDSTSPVRILVPTRYAELANRRWRHDSWSYCLVVAPDPPFRSWYWGFDTSIVVTPAELEAGGAATIDVVIVSEESANVLVVVEVRDANDGRIARWAWDDQPLAAGARTHYTVQWQVPDTTAPGLYVVKVGLFAPGGGKLRHWNDGTAVLLVRPAAKPGR
jgi:hypothetical protein